MRTKLKQPRRFRVGILIPGYSGFYGEVLRGIRQFAMENRAWQLLYRSNNEPVSENDGFDGVLIDLSGVRASMTQSYKGPQVQLANLVEITGVLRVGMDEEAAGRLAAGHFLANRHRHFGFVGYANTTYVDLRLKGFVEGLGDQAENLRVLRIPHTDESWSIPIPELIGWVRSLPNPTAVMACHDGLALRLAQTCHAAKLNVPGDIAIVGVDNVGPDCEMGEPPLSSVSQPMQLIGHTAAKLLDRMMRGETVPFVPVLLPPAGLAIRESSDAAAVEDALVRDAVRYITDNLHRSVDVADLVDAMAVSRSTLERRFRSMLGRAPLEEIRRLRLLRAQELLAQTSLVLNDIAGQTGFSYATHLCNAFRKEFGQTPTQYRDRFHRQ